MASDGYFRDIVDAAVTQGWRVDKTNKGHWRFIPPGPGEIIITSGTPSDKRAVHNCLARLKRAGFSTPG